MVHRHKHKRKSAVLAAIFAVILVVAATGISGIGISHSAAQDQINYISQPDELTVFLNDVVFVRDELRVPTDTETRIVLPSQVVPNTLTLVDENGRLPLYAINYENGQIVLTIRDEGETSAGGDVRLLTLEYIALGGINWQPLYDLRLTSGTSGNVDFDFFAAIQNDAFKLNETQVNLVAGRVDVGGQVPAAGFSNFNQTFGDFQATQTAPAFFATPTPLPTITSTPTPAPITPSTTSTPAPMAETPVPVGSVLTQSVYRLPPLTAEPGTTLYVEVLETTFSSRQVLSWNASTNAQATIIYKVTNTSDIPLTEGIVRSYQDGVFLGSDEIEYTPPGSEGSVTVGPLRDVRVLREVTRVVVPAENPNDEDGTEILNEITLTLTNLTGDAREIEVVDVYPAQAFSFQFNREPERQGGNVLRWLVITPPDEGIRITYTYRTPF